MPCPILNKRIENTTPLSRAEFITTTGDAVTALYDILRRRCLVPLVKAPAIRDVHHSWNTHGIWGIYKLLFSSQLCHIAPTQFSILYGLFIELRTQ
jgi:hypothetical protein